VFNQFAYRDDDENESFVFVPPLQLRESVCAEGSQA